MRKINRINLDTWTQIELNENRKYNLPWVKEKLREMQSYRWGILCCYCECELKDNSYYDIEHVKPKKKFPSEKFVWNNLLLCCNRCNRSYKNDDYKNWFLNPSDTWYSFEENFDFNEECFYLTKNSNAELTCDITKLNDKDKHSFKSRLKLTNKLQKKLEFYKKNVLSNDKIIEGLKMDLMLEWELESFWNWFLERLLRNLKN